MNKIYYETVWGFKILNPLVKIIDYIRYAFIPDKVKMRNEFIKNLNYSPNFNDPKTFNEKVQWLKLNDRLPIHTICADKYAVRNYVINKIGEKYLVPLVFKTENIRDINEDTIPNYPVIVKTNHDSSGGIIIKDKSAVNWVNTQNILGKNLSINYYYRFKEWQYKHVKPLIIVEKLLQTSDGKIPNDYKMYFFNGELQFTQVDMGKSENKWRRNLYDNDWNLLNFLIKRENGESIKKPELFDEMISLGKKLAEPFSFVRVDFYYFDNTIYFGELTFHPQSGHSKFIPESFDVFYGEKLKLHKAKA